MKRRFADFAPGEAMLANDVQLFSEAQFAARHEPAGGVDHAVALRLLIDFFSLAIEHDPGARCAKRAAGDFE